MGREATSVIIPVPNHIVVQLELLFAFQGAKRDVIASESA